MKKLVSVTMVFALLVMALSGCAGPSGNASQRGAPASDRRAYSQSEGAIGAAFVPGEAGDGDASAVDVDLTVLSSTMVYAEVYNIFAFPDVYMGKTIKMSGPYYASYYDVTDQYYHYVIIEDATACCAEGMEFIRDGEHIYPDDYPETGAIVEVTGIISSYEELGYAFIYIAVDSMTLI